MKKIILLKICCLTILFCSCNKNENKYVLDGYILAGQKIGKSIDYRDINPDIKCTIVNPWINTDTIINLDLNKDGVDDFSIKKTMCSPSMLGTNCESVTIIPLKNNEICVNINTNWLDTLPKNDSISIINNWTNKESLVYSYLWVMDGETTTNGYWQKVNEINKNYIGLMIQKADKKYFGWIGMKSDSNFHSFDFYISDYAILKEYKKD
jgi:hypothetical protein